MLCRESMDESGYSRGMKADKDAISVTFNTVEVICDMKFYGNS